MTNGTENVVSPRVQEAHRLDAAEFIAKSFKEQWEAKADADAKAKADAEASALQKTAVANHAQNMVNKWLAKGVVRKAFPKKRKSFADWLHAVQRRDTRYLKEHYESEFGVDAADHLNPARKAAMGESSGATGGYTVPNQYAKQIMAIVAEVSFIRPGAQVVPMSSSTLQYPLLDVTTPESAGVSPFAGGINLQWTAEGLTRPETEPAFKQLELRAWELSGYALLSQPVLDDSPALSSYLMTVIAWAVAWAEEYAFLQGNGAGKPQGILSASATIAQNRQTANQIGYADVSTMLSKLPPSSLESCLFAASATALPQLLQLKDGAGRAAFAAAGDDNVGPKRRFSLCGIPLAVTEKLPALGTKGDLVLVDPRYYVIGDRSLEIAFSNAPAFPKNQAACRVTARRDGQPWFDKPATLQDGTTQVSPFVVLN